MIRFSPLDFDWIFDLKQQLDLLSEVQSTYTATGRCSTE